MNFKPTLTVDFGKQIRQWDGFGVNYVEACQTRDYQAEPQDYGGFSYLSEDQRQQIIDMTFGEDGLKPGVIKMFLDPFHQAEPNEDYDYDANVIDMDAYDHKTTTAWMRYFVREGLRVTRAHGRDLGIVTTLYGPPGWMTLQRFVRGRDIDPELKTEVAKYMISWTKWLREVEGFPVKFISLHNEGEDWIRWPLDGTMSGDERHDYNLYWSPELVADFLQFMSPMLTANGLEDVGITPGETTGWYRFYSWGYADAIADNPNAVQKLGLITSHGFFGGNNTNEWFNDWRSLGTDTIREKRPDLHAWVTSTSWKNMDVFFVNELRNTIYSTKVNAIIPWATIQLQGHWEGGDPNPGTAFKTWDDGRYEVTPGYYYFKQVCRAGQPGMAVCRALANDRLTGLIAFGCNNTPNANAFVLLNMWNDAHEYEITVKGAQNSIFEAYRTHETDQYASLGEFELNGETLSYIAPPRSVTTFFET